MSGSGRTASHGYRVARNAYRDHARRLDLACWLCLQAIDYAADHLDPNAFQLDHVVPVSVRPDLELDPGNFRPAHRSCNNARNVAEASPTIGRTTRRW